MIFTSLYHLITSMLFLTFVWFGIVHIYNFKGKDVRPIDVGCFAIPLMLFLVLKGYI
jgi:hypothetical protein